MSRPTESSLDTIAQGLGDQLDVLDATRARRMIEARLFPRSQHPPKIGRFELREMLGAGGMGVVYAAHDPGLGREVAIKMLHPSGTAGSPEHLGREARALARVSHPNVVTVFEVGTDEGQWFFVMELVRGQTLDEWCTTQRESCGEDPRKWSRAVVHAYVEAGRGLAAIHAAQLVHLDFKPSNVLVGADGRVRVTDFGIVRIADPHLDIVERSASMAATDHTVSTRLGGTPAYMSPEQLLGTRVDLRSDVFSYCVALYEALYGCSPYPAESIGKKIATFAQGDVVVAHRRGIPRRVSAALQRGLSIAPAARWPTMGSLLAALEPPTRPRVWIASALGLAIGGATVFAMVPHRDEPPACRQAPELAAEVWSPARAEAIREGFASTGLPYADQAASLAGLRLQSYADAWITAHTNACVATRVHGHQSDTVLARRMECLDERLVELDALADVFAAADRATVEAASEAMGMLAPIDVCADAAALAEVEALPTDPDLRARAEALRAALAQARASVAADGSEAAAERARGNVATARELGHEPLLLSALVESAVRHYDILDFDACEAAAHEALQLLQRVRADRHEATVWRTLMNAHSRRGDSRRALELVPALDLASGRSHDPDVLVRAHLAVSRVSTESGDLDAAQARLDSAEAVLRTHPSPDQFARLLLASSTLARRRGALTRARELDIQSVLLMLALHGPDHPTVAIAMRTLAIEEQVLGHPERAIELLERALAIEAPLIAEDGLEMAQILNNLGAVLWRSGRVDDARERLVRAEAISVQRLGDADPNTALVRLNLAAVERLSGDLVAAEGLALACLQAFRAGFGDLDPRVAAALEELGQIDLAREQWSSAQRHYSEALTIRERAQSDQIDSSLLGLARAARGLGDFAGARARAQDVVERSIARGEPWRGNRLHAELELAHLELAAGEREMGLARMETVRVRARNPGLESYAREAAEVLAAAAGTDAPG